MKSIIYNQAKLNEIAHKYGLRFVILHGSYAKGSPRKDSDLDIAILGYKEIDFEDFLKLYQELENIFPMKCELDFKTLHKTDPLFRYEVIKNSKLLYGGQTDYENYKTAVFCAYKDSKSLRDLEYILIKKYQKYLNKLTYA